MAVRRVFVIWTDPIFYESVRLLLKHPDIIWVGATSDVTTAHEEIISLRPDTVLLEKTKADFPMDVLEILKTDRWNMRIIELSLDTNEMHLYHRETMTVVEAGDLLHFVLG